MSEDADRGALKIRVYNLQMMPRSISSQLFALVVAIALLLATGGHAQTPLADAQAPHVRAELLLNTDHLTASQQGIAAVVVTIDDGYHAQSSQPLDANLIPFKIAAHADAGVTMLDPLYPPGELEDFPALGGKISVFSGKTVAFVPFTVADDAPIGSATIVVDLRLQICNDQACDRPVTLKLAVSSGLGTKEPARSINGDIFKQFDANRWLNKHDAATTKPALETAKAGNALWTPFSNDALAATRKAGKPVIIDFTAAWCVNCHVVERRVYGDEATLAELRKRGATLMKADLTEDGAPGSELLAKLNPSRSIPFTAIYFGEKPTPAGLNGIYSSVDLIATLNDAGKTETSTTKIFGFELASAGLPIKLLVALGVGVLLNAVPCVLPVLPLKAMSFYEDAGHSRSRSMLNGGAFSLGVIVTFGALALFVITQDALWGKFISHPITAVVLSLVLLGAAAQAFGLFEIVLPRALTNLDIANENYAAANAASTNVGRKLVANFFSGILIAVLSTPCTIGVFAAVIAVAITAGAALGSIILMCVGVGMALPWFVLSAFPEATRRFPRTGPWPSVVKQMTAFLLLATAIFFAAPVLPAGFRASGLWWLIFACVAAAGIFLIARTIQITPRARPIAISTCVAALLVAGGLVMTLALTA